MIVHIFPFEGSSFENVVSDFGQVSWSIYDLGSSSEESVSGSSGFCPSSCWFTVIVVCTLSEFEHFTRQGETQRGRCYLHISCATSQGCMATLIPL